MSTFTWTPDTNAQGKTKPRVLVAKFGDGYEQRLADGINNIGQEYNLTFSLLNTATFQAIDNFLRATNGATAFDWTPPAGVAGRYVCEDWSVTYDHVTYTIQATFKQVFGI